MDNNPFTVFKELQMQNSQSNFYSIGIDVGGTNTDAVIFEYPSRRIVNSIKVSTTKDFYTGILQAIKQVLLSQKEITEYNISSVMIGTTAFNNALIQCSSELCKVNVIRICGTASHAFPPFITFPEKLRNALQAEHFFVNGGYEFDKREITKLDENEIRDIAGKICKEAVGTNTSISIALCGIFSPLCSDQEEKVAEILKEEFAKTKFEDYSITLSHKIAQIGLLEREGSAILNASVQNMARKYIAKLKHAIGSLNLVNCANNIYFTSNDGTLITCEEAAEYPVFTFNSGPANSLRGAWQLCKVKEDALVIDIGGTTSDIAVLKNGFPRLASSYTEVAGVRTNFRMPDTLSIGLGGGSLVEFNQDKCSIGPISVGYKLKKEAKSFGGNVLTTSDIALASGAVKIEGADPSKAGTTQEQIKLVQDEIIRKLELLVDKMKTNADPLPLILVGGGSILVPDNVKLEGVSNVIKPENFAVANAVGAAIAQVSALIETIVDLEGKDRLAEIKIIKDAAKKQAIEKGATPDTIETIIDEVHLSYAIKPLVRVTCKAVGDLDISKIAENAAESSQSSKLETIVIENEEIEPFILDPTRLRYEEIVFEMKPPTVGFNQKEDRKEWILSEEDTEYIALGAGILGTGGGGSPYIGKLLLKKVIREGKKVKVISPDELGEDDHAVASAIYGAPYVIIERMPSAVDALDAAKEVIKYVEESNKKVTCISTAEIGGLNSMVPLYTGGLLGLPVVDIDYMGRAFPEYQMITPFFYNKPCTPVCMSNEKGNHLLIREVENNDPLKAEKQLRACCIDYGLACGICCPPLSKKDINEIAIKYSISRAWRLGGAIVEARKKKENPLKVIEEKENGKLLFVGKVIDVHRKTEGGFTKGNLTIQGLDSYKGQNMDVNFQNENLVAQIYPEDKSEEKKCVGIVPDLICIVNTESYEPILSEDLKYGLRVSVLYLPASKLLKTPEAMKYISPEVFGYKNVPKVVFEKEYVNPRCVLDEY